MHCPVLINEEIGRNRTEGTEDRTRDIKEVELIVDIAFPAQMLRWFSTWILPNFQERFVLANIKGAKAS